MLVMLKRQFAMRIRIFLVMIMICKMHLHKSSEMAILMMVADMVSIVVDQCAQLDDALNTLRSWQAACEDLECQEDGPVSQHISCKST